MALITSDFLNSFFINLKVLWNDAYNTALAPNSAWQRYALEVPSTTDTEQWGWMGSIPQMREWIDTRAVSGLENYNYSLKNKHYEATIEVDRDTLEDDRYNLIAPKVSQLGLEAAQFPSRQMSATLAAGGTGLGYDGVAFFAATHVSGASGTQSNTQAGTGVTLAAIRTDLVGAKTKMLRFKDDTGRLLRVSPDLIVAPPELEDVFLQLLNTQIIALSSGTQQSNVLQGTYDLMIDPELTDANDWFLMATQYPVKPFIFQNRKNPEFASVTDPNSWQVFNTRQFYYGVDSRFAIGYGMWQFAMRTTN